MTVLLDQQDVAGSDERDDGRSPRVFDVIQIRSVASPFRAFRVFRSALFPKSLQPSAYLPE
jgi:hypothetical protein